MKITAIITHKIDGQQVTKNYEFDNSADYHKFLHVYDIDNSQIISEEWNPK